MLMLLLIEGAIGIGHVSIKVDPATKNCSITNLQWLIHVCQSLYSKVST